MSSHNLDHMRRYGIEVELISSISRNAMCHEINSRIDFQAYGLRPSSQRQIITAGYSDKSNKWRLKSDCSIRETREHPYGMEFVTPILKGEDDLRLVLDIIKILDEFGTVNRSCGVHCHIDIANAASGGQVAMFADGHIKRIPGQGAKALGRLIKTIGKYQGAINSLLPNSRRGNNNHYCSDAFYSGVELDELFNEFKSSSSRTLIRNWQGGRGKWNLNNYWNNATIENRAHSGTLNCDKIENWVRLTQAIVAYAFESTRILYSNTNQPAHVSSYSTRHLLDTLKSREYITSKTKRFYINRYKELNDAICV